MPHDSPAFALLLGFGSAISLVIGAAIGLVARPRARVTSVLMAFGAGALLFALSIEIVAHSYHVAGYAPLAIGCVAGGLLFELLNQLINQRGGFLRKGATLLYQVTRTKRLRAADVVDHLARVNVFRALPPDEIAKLVPHIDLLEFPKGAEVCAEGDPCDEFFLVDQGSVNVTQGHGTKVLSTLGPGAVFGEMELLSGSPYVASLVVAADDTALYRLRREDFERLLAASPATQLLVSALARTRLEEASPKGAYGSLSDNRWRRSTIRHLTAGDLAPTRAEVQAVASEHSQAHGAVLGIWLGILLDGIPESLVIGLSLLGATQTPWGLVAGVFLANLPEAMSSSVVMRQQGFSVARILGLWSAVVLVTSAGAAFGNAVLRGLDPEVFAVIEGCAAGAMLTSIAETMLPEAYHQGGWVVGLSTLAGFLAALGIKAATGG